VVALSGENIKAKPFGCSCLAALTFSPASAGPELGDGGRAVPLFRPAGEKGRKRGRIYI